MKLFIIYKSEKNWEIKYVSKVVFFTSDLKYTTFVSNTLWMTLTSGSIEPTLRYKCLLV